MGGNCGYKGGGEKKRDEWRLGETWSADLDVEGLSFGFARGADGGEGVGDGFFGGDADTAIGRRPDGIVLRREGDGFGVGYTIAELGCISAFDRGGIRKKHLNVEVFAAELVDGGAVLLVLFFGAGFGIAAFDVFIVLVAIKEDPAGNAESDEDGDAAVEERVFEGGVIRARSIGSR